jgi:flagellar biosynthesis protein FlhB
MIKFNKDKKGSFALSHTAEMILILIGLILLIFFIYFMRDKIMEVIDVVLEFLSP